MTIVALKRVTVIGHGDDKEQVIADLQAVGVLHLIPLTDTGEPSETAGGPSRAAREALQFLASCPFQRRQVTAAIVKSNTGGVWEDGEIFYHTNHADVCAFQ